MQLFHVTWFEYKRKFSKKKKKTWKSQQGLDLWGCSATMWGPEATWETRAEAGLRSWVRDWIWGWAAAEGSSRRWPLSGSLPGPGWSTGRWKRIRGAGAGRFPEGTWPSPCTADWAGSRNQAWRRGTGCRRLVPTICTGFRARTSPVRRGSGKRVSSLGRRTSFPWPWTTFPVRLDPLMLLHVGGVGCRWTRRGQNGQGNRVLLLLAEQVEARVSVSRAFPDSWVVVMELNFLLSFKHEIKREREREGKREK